MRRGFCLQFTDDYLASHSDCWHHLYFLLIFAKGCREGRAAAEDLS